MDGAYDFLATAFTVPNLDQSAISNSLIKCVPNIAAILVLHTNIRACIQHQRPLLRHLQRTVSRSVLSIAGHLQ